MRHLKSEALGIGRLAFPLALSQLGSHLMGLVDIAVVGRFSESALAAVGLGNSVFFGIGVLGMGVMLALDPILSQAVGAKKDGLADGVFWQGVWLALMLTVPIAALIEGTTWFLHLTPIEGPVVEQATSYIRPRLLAIAPFYIFIGARSYIQALDFTRPLVLSVVVANVVNLPLDFALVFGVPEMGLEAMGAKGAGIATFVCAVIQALIVTGWAAHRRPSLMTVSRAIDWATIVRALQIGTPIALTLFAEVAFFSMTGVIVGWLGPTALAAHSVALTLAGTTFQVALALGSAASVRVGQAIGAGDTPRARRAGFLSVALCTGWMSLGAFVFLCFPKRLSSWMTSEPDVIAAASSLMVAAATFQLVDGAQAVMNGALRGAGDTRFAFVANAVGHYLIGLPFALVTAFVFDWGALGLWWGLCAGLAAVSIILTARFWSISRATIRPV